MHRLKHLGCGVLAVLALAPVSAHADPSAQAMATVATRPAITEPTGSTTPPRADAAPVEHTSREAASAPLPGEESGRLDHDPGDSLARRLARGALFVPRFAFQVATSPLYGAAYAFDKLHPDNRPEGPETDRVRTLSIAPTAAYESGFGGIAGVRVTASNLAGEHERATAEVSTGAITGETGRWAAGLELDSGARFGDRLQLGVIGSYERRPNDPFYGIGNADATRTPPPAPIDPRTDDTAFEVHDREQEVRVALAAAVRLAPDLHVTASGELARLDFAPSGDGAPIADAYMVAVIPGFESGVREATGALELRWDTRHRVTPWEIYGTTEGSLAQISAGRVHRLDGGADYWRYSAEAQHLFRIGRGGRLLSARVRASGVTGGRGDVPFSELPELGGGDVLRGYAFDRFRDRAALVGSLQYEWDLSHFLAAYVFGDAGRVYDSFDDVSVHDLRVGFGGGLEVRHSKGVLFDASVASSIDGGVLVSLTFNPTADVRARWQ